MNQLNIETINRKAPYPVVQIEGLPHLYYFHTDHGVDYEISIKANDMFIPSGAYTLDIRNIYNQPSPGDDKLRLTLLALIEEFFRCNNDVMLYVTETKDEKQAVRNRLFVRWFNKYELHHQYVIRIAQGKMDGQMNFMAIILRKDNLKLQMAIEEFEETVRFLFE